MKSLLLIIAFSFSLSFSYSQENSEFNFPESYFGNYTGNLVINSNKGINNYPMEFHLRPTDSSEIFEYVIVYGKGEQRQERNYTLKTKDVEKGLYTLDENNGILLDCKVIGNKIYFLFEVSDNLLSTFITFNTNDLIFEIIATNTKQKMVSGGQDEDTPEVFSYPINVVQRALLIKQ